MPKLVEMTCSLTLAHIASYVGYVYTPKTLINPKKFLYPQRFCDKNCKGSKEED